MVDAIGANNTRVDLNKWKKLTAQEILKEESKGEDIPAELITWAQQMAAFSKIPDNVTYEQVDGDFGIEALNKLGLTEEPMPEEEPVQPPVKTEEPDAVKDVTKTPEEEEPDNNIFANPPEPGNAADTKPTEEEENEAKELEALTLADSDITADDETIRKRKERKGLA